MLLWKYSSAFVTGADIEFSDLLVASLICAQEVDEAERMLNTWRLPFFCKIWSRIVGTKLNLAGELAMFKRYREGGCWFPDVNVPGDLKGIASPWPIRLLSKLMSDFHMSEKQALAMPMQWATALYCAHAEMAQEIELFTEQDKSNFAGARELMERANRNPQMWDF